jgi:hypothetical protein
LLYSCRIYGHPWVLSNAVCVSEWELWVMLLYMPCSSLSAIRASDQQVIHLRWVSLEASEAARSIRMPQQGTTTWQGSDRLIGYAKRSVQWQSRPHFLFIPVFVSTLG